MKSEKRNKRRVTFTPEELGLERITINGKRYIDVTPLWIDCKQAQEIQKIIEMKCSYEDYMQGRLND